MSSEETVVLEVEEQDSSGVENTSNSELEAEAKAKAKAEADAAGGGEPAEEEISPSVKGKKGSSPLRPHEVLRKGALEGSSIGGHPAASATTFGEDVGSWQRRLRNASRRLSLEVSSGRRSSEGNWRPRYHP